MVALSALILADRGDLDLDAPVASYWPEFVTAGKERVLLRHLPSHTAGLPEFDPPIAVADLGRSVRYGLGYGIFDPACGWGGWGGSMVMVDLDARMAVAYVMNQMLPSDYRGLGIVLAAYDALG